ncbi:MAG: TonB-dependent receptor [Gammaproteobacteria bacterium]|nr:TonB-dependent receptor [Gammaproteobacteria bacterium]
MKKQHKFSLLSVAVASALSSPMAFAQESEEDVEKIVVTGSRVAQSANLEAASPVLAIGSDDVKASGQIDIGALLRESPQLQASLPGSFSAFNGTPLGASLLNLRNLGSDRTLVVEDGRRHVSGIEGTGSVDVNTMSTALLSNIEILTGGASAVYGADAVSGVVNFNMRKGNSFDGVEVRSQAGVSGHGDANEFFVSIANGFSSGDAEGVFAIEYQTTSPVYAGDRDFAGSGEYTSVANTEATQNAFGVDPKFANTWVSDWRLPISSDRGVIALSYSAFGSVSNASWVDYTCDDRLGSIQTPVCMTIGDDGELKQYNTGDVFIGPFDAVGGDGVPASPDSELILPESERVLVQSTGSYIVSDSMRLFANAKFVFSETKETNQVNGFNDDIPIAFDNPYIPAELMSRINTLNDENVPISLVMSRDVLDVTGNSNPEAQRQTYRVVLGVDGIIPGTELDYEVSLNYGRTDADITTRERLEDRYFAAIDAVTDPATGNVVCRSELDTTALPPTSPFPVVNDDFDFNTFTPGQGECVPINLFGKNSISQEGANWIFQPGKATNDIEQKNVLAVVSGDTAEYFELPAGPISFAVGYEWREEVSAYTPSPYAAQGLTFGTLDSRSGPTNASSGSYDVSEMFFEAQVPLIEGAFLAERLEFRTAFRTSDYDPYGSHDAWTLGGVWSPAESLTFRATLSEAVRVPNITEAFAPTFAATIAAGADPCNQNEISAGSEFRRDNCIALIGQSVADGTYDSTNFLSAFVSGTTGGNENLSPEVAETTTVGLVFNPVEGIFDGVTFTMDYYEIKIDGLIDSLSGFDIAQNCVDAPTINNQFCDAVQRDATNGFITDFQSGYINLASVETEGIDFRLDYQFESLALTLNGTHFMKHEEVRDVSAPDEVTDVLGTFTRPEWIVNVSADYVLDQLTIGWRGRFEDDQLLPGLELQDIESDPNYISETSTGTAFTHDISVSYDLSEGLEIYGGVNNVLEEEPFLGTLSRPAGPRGRFFYLGLNYDM